MDKRNNIQKLVLSSLFLCLAYIFPFFTGQIPEFGSMLCPMHLPVILCGFICGWKYGLIVGVVSPLLRSLTLYMPPLFPTAFSMSFELGAYGLISGWLYNEIFSNFKFNKNLKICLTLIISMIIGRVVYGSIMFILLGFNKVNYSMKLFWVGTIVESLPGIIIQLIFIPIIVNVYEKYKKS